MAHLFKILIGLSLGTPILAFAQDVRIGEVSVSIVLGDVTRQGVDAIVVPQFKNSVSWGGVGGAVARRGGDDALEAAENYIKQEKPNYGAAFVIHSQKMNVNLVNVISVGSEKDAEF